MYLFLKDNYKVGSLTYDSGGSAFITYIGGGNKWQVNNSGNGVLSGSIKTGTPTGGTAQPWKMGQYNTTAPSATGYVEVDINGTLYKLLAST